MLWCVLFVELSDSGMLLVYCFFVEVCYFDVDVVVCVDWFELVSVFVLLMMLLLYVVLLCELLCWIDVCVYVLNLCCEFWFDIVIVVYVEVFDVVGWFDY